MKHRNLLASLAVLIIFTGCNHFLDREPISDITPSNFLFTENDLSAYTIGAYTFPSHDKEGAGTFAFDNHTDNQVTTLFSNVWVPGDWRVPQSEPWNNERWSFRRIRNMNYYLQTVVPRWHAGLLKGSTVNIEHYIGEGYFLRGYEYFTMVQRFGDFPIVKHTLPDSLDVLIKASARKPRNEVARFIIQDLDSAISLLSGKPIGGKNRITKQAALLFKSRVALHEATWLNYHKGTAHVPGGNGWPGATKNPGFTLDIDAEIDYFLTQAMNAASAVADSIPLVTNTKDDGYNSSQNPYFTMFGDVDLDKYPEVLLWRAYDITKENLSHNTARYITMSGANTGYTRGFVDNFLMANGLPIYDLSSGYVSDDSTHTVKIGRDNRLQIFMKAPGELHYIDKEEVEKYPEIFTTPEVRWVTGYPVKKGQNYLVAQSERGKGSTGSIVFRAVEAYLNYIEASYLKKGVIDEKADQYWRAIRKRAGVEPDYMITVGATDMNKEAKNDFAAYSAGNLLSDKILYNIRRERRCEFMAEGMRMFDLKRWRALDQLKTHPYIVEGFKIWGPMQMWYYDKIRKRSSLIEPGGTRTPNVSKKSESLYLRPYRINLSNTNLVKDGYRWAYAHYLEPIAIQNLLITSTNTSDLSSSSIYQNPYWPTEGNLGAID